VYSEYKLNAVFDNNRRITDLKTGYRVTIVPPSDLPSSFYEYSEGFLCAAHYITTNLLDTDCPDISKLDSYFFSLAFLYRHSIELILKAIAFRNIQSNKDRADFAKNTFHDLSGILNEILKLESFSGDVKELDWLQKYLADFSKMDKASDSFRYPFHIKRIPGDIFSNESYSIERVFEAQTRIDLVLFANKFEIAYQILDKWYLHQLNTDITWKEYKPIFIEEGGYYYGSSVVGYGYSREDFYPYVSAYAETAGYIRTEMSKLYDDGKTTEAEKLFMPMCYLYRNAVELAIKSAWFEQARENFQYKCKVLYKRKHSIAGLWNRLRGWIESYWKDNPKNGYFDDITRLCNELQGYDSTASKFRYPCTKDMELYFKRICVFDFINVSEFMESLIDALDNVACELSVRNECIDEMEAEIRAEMRAEMESYMY